MTGLLNKWKRKQKTVDIKEKTAEAKTEIIEGKMKSILPQKETVTQEPSVQELEYRSACRKRTTWFTVGLSGLFTAEILAMVWLGTQFQSNQIISRLSREYRIQTSGTIALSSGTYDGETDFGYFSGNGKFQFTDGAVYSGNWSKNKMEGIGSLEVPSEGIYEGEFRDSRKNGTGTFTWKDGTVYSGDWKDDQMWGQGEYTSSSQVIYSGSFYKNQFQTGDCTFQNDTGTYRLVYKEGNIDTAVVQYTDGSSYTGGCDENSLNGFGTMSFADGDIYTGSFASGVRKGKGQYTWTSGDRYDGEWSNDQMNGAGTYTWADGSCASGTFSGNSFMDGSYHIENGFGSYTFTIKGGQPTAVEMNLVSGTRYNGSMNEGKLSGQAQIQYSNGDQYSGTVSNGQKTGQGTYRWTSGAYYEGAWNADQMEGAGTYFYAANETGYKLAGAFSGGRPNGQCQYYTDENISYQTDWESGKCVKVYE